MNVIGDAINGVSADDDSVDPGVLETYAEIGDMLADGKKFSFRNFAIAIVAGLILALVAGGIVSAKMPRGQGYDMHGRPTWSPQAREWQAKQASIGVGIAVFMAVSLLTYQCLPRKREE